MQVSNNEHSLRANTKYNQDIHEKKDLLLSIIEQSPVGNFIYCGNQFVYVNPAFVDLLGYSEQEVYVEHFLEHVITPSQLSILEKVIQRIQKGIRIRSGYRIPLRKKDNSLVHFDIIQKPILFNGEPAIVGTILDVTARVELEQALKKSHYLMRQSHKIAGIASWYYEFSGNTITWSDELYQVLELDHSVKPSNEIVKNLLHPEDFVRVSRSIKRAFKGEPHDIEFRCLLPNGEERNIHSVVNIEFDSFRKPLQIIGVLQDVTRQKRIERQLQVSQQRYASLFENSPNLVCSLDLDGKILQVNPTFIEKTGYPEHEIVGTHFAIYLDPQDYVKNKHIFKDVLHGKSIYYEATGVTKQGRELHLDINTLPVFIDQEMVGMFGIARDISSEKEAKRMLEDSEQRYRSLFDHNMDSVIELDLEGRIVNCNPMSEQISGYSRRELLGSVFFSFLYEEDMKSSMVSFAEVKNGVAKRIQVAMLGKKGNRVDLDVNALPIVLRNGIGGVYAIVRDITEQKKSEHIIKTMAYHDPLTGLPNRRLIMERLDILLSLTKQKDDPLAILFIDLDRLKTVNDSLGHTVGDILIQQVAKRLQTCVRKGDTLARLGGDEFAILLPDLHDLEVPKTVAKRVLDSFRKPFLLQGKEFYTSASVGIAYSPEHGRDVETLIRNADTAMYEVKYNGKNDFRIYKLDIGKHQQKRFELETALYDALQRDEFILHYQPRIETKTGRPIGAEALLRWDHPKLGLVSPAEFIPIAEETGLIVPLGDWVIKQACKQVKQWQLDNLPPIRVSVNVSARQFQRSNVFETIENALKESGIEANCLEIEITEGTLMQNEVGIIRTIQQLIDIGIHVSIDDFGTGYSSMSYLKQFNIQTLKIDRSFISGVPYNRNNAAIAKALIDLAHSLHMSVVAEGVETKEEMAFLLENHSDEVQGYHISRPLPADQLPHVLSKIQTVHM